MNSSNIIYYSIDKNKNNMFIHSIFISFFLTEMSAIYVEIVTDHVTF